jgi:4-hydroxy-3-methylbut-2-enyl diphosphate reductase
MEIIVASKGGFCFGVKKAIDSAVHETEVNHEHRIYTYGPIIHNHQVIAYLETLGIQEVDTIEGLEAGSTLIIRSHGVPYNFYESAKANDLIILDATCIFVKKVQKIARDAYLRNETVLIIGDVNHPEVVAIKGWCDNRALVVKDLAALRDISLPSDCALTLVAQTTLNQSVWHDIETYVNAHYPQAKLFNTICSATQERQDEVEKIAKKVDAMVVIGGMHSSNTQKLYEISKKIAQNAYHIESASELTVYNMQKYDKIGIVAGASTPNWIVKEVIAYLESEGEALSMDNGMMSNEMQALMEESLIIPRRGSIVKGRVEQITDNDVMVSIGYKSDGIIPRNEVLLETGMTLRDVFKLDQEIEVSIIKLDDGQGNVLLSYKRARESYDWTELEAKFEEKALIDVKITGLTKGGLIATYGNARGFIPASHIALGFEKDLTKYVGQTVTVQMLDLNKMKRRMTLSRKELLQEQESTRKETFWAGIHDGAMIEGTVKRISNFGAFVDIGGYDGLVHISELSWGRVNKPQDAVKVGQKVMVKILSTNREDDKISLSLKQATQNPWEIAVTKYAAETDHEARVLNMTDFGAFVELEPGVEGLVHVSQISNKRVEKPSSVLTIGQVVKVKVLELNIDEKKLKLSMKALEPKLEEIVTEVEATEPEIAQTESDDQEA